MSSRGGWRARTEAVADPGRPCVSFVATSSRGGVAASSTRNDAAVHELGQTCEPELGGGAGRPAVASWDGAAASSAGARDPEDLHRNDDVHTPSQLGRELFLRSAPRFISSPVARRVAGPALPAAQQATRPVPPLNRAPLPKLVLRPDAARERERPVPGFPSEWIRGNLVYSPYCLGILIFLIYLF